MDDSNNEYPQHLRSDSITGISNSLAFFEWLLSHTRAKPTLPFTLISLDVNNLAQLNKDHGHAAGDAALRWVALVLLEEAQAQVYRISGDEFVGVLTEGSTQNHAESCERVQARLAAESSQVNLEPPAASMAMIHFSGLEEISPEDVLGVIYGAFLDIKSNPGNTFKVFDAATTTTTTKTGLINDMVKRIVSLGSMLDKSHRLAYRDLISGLPNVHAVSIKLQEVIKVHESMNLSFGVVLIDGDDLGIYNKVSYLAGDEMIKDLGTILQGQMRPSDFLARWRTGDEFLILLQESTIDQAVSIADRLRTSVIDLSQDWIYPITISAGVAGYQYHGTTAEVLLHHAEQALNQAKTLGKNRVIVLP